MAVTHQSQGPPSSRRDKDESGDNGCKSEPEVHSGTGLENSTAAASLEQGGMALGELKRGLVSIFLNVNPVL